MVTTGGNNGTERNDSKHSSDPNLEPAGMNESQIQIEWPEESVLIKPKRLAAGVTWEKEISGKEWDEIQTGMGREYDAMAAECGTGSIYRLTAEAAAVLQNENTEWTVLCVDYKNGSYQNRLCLDAKEKQPLKTC